mgnify:CR=1 FL=1
MLRLHEALSNMLESRLSSSLATPSAGLSTTSGRDHGEASCWRAAFSSSTATSPSASTGRGDGEDARARHSYKSLVPGRARKATKKPVAELLSDSPTTGLVRERARQAAATHPLLPGQEWIIVKTEFGRDTGRSFMQQAHQLLLVLFTETHQGQ